MQRSAASISWLARSDCPLDWGWNPEKRLGVAPKAAQNAHHTPVRDDIHWDAMKAENVLDQEVRGLS